MARQHVSDASRHTREPVNLTVDPLLLAEARALAVPLSATLDEALRAKVAEARRAKWLRENAEAIVLYNERVNESGTFSDELRRF